MPNNRARTEIHPEAFIKFAFPKQKAPPAHRKLTDQQQTIRDLTKMQGMTAKQISKMTGISLGCVYDGLVKCREKGHVV